MQSIKRMNTCWYYSFPFVSSRVHHVCWSEVLLIAARIFQLGLRQMLNYKQQIDLIIFKWQQSLLMKLLCLIINGSTKFSFAWRATFPFAGHSLLFPVTTNTVYRSLSELHVSLYHHQRSNITSFAPIHSHFNYTQSEEMTKTSLRV